MASKSRRVAAALFRAVNPLVRPLLRSRWHRVLSGRLMLLSYPGPRTGTTYTFPIGYFRIDDDELLSFSSTSWWTQVGPDRPVRLRVAGTDLTARAEPVTDTDAKAALIGRFVELFGPPATRQLVLGLPADRPPTPEERRAAAARTTLIRFRLG